MTSNKNIIDRKPVSESTKQSENPDITERMQSEEALRKSEQRFRSLVEITSDWVWEVDQNGVYTYVSPGVKVLLGYEPEEIIGKTPFDLMPPDEAVRVGGLFRDIADSRKPFTGLENINLHKNGRAVVLETSGVPILDAGGYLLGYRGIDRDITERKKTEDEREKLVKLLTDAKDKYEAEAIERQKAEEALAKTVTEYTAMINTVPALVYFKDIDRRYLIVNDALCEFIKKDRSHIIGKTNDDIFPHKEASEILSGDSIIMEENKEIVEQDRMLVCADGEIKWFSTTKVPLRANDGSIIGIVGLIQDITDQHRGREQLVQSEKLAAIGTLAAGVAHEINNPIGYINSNLNTMGKYLKKIKGHLSEIGAREKEEQEEIDEILADFNDAINESTEGTDKVKVIVADLKSFSRVDRAEKEHTNINEGIESTLNVVWNELKYNCKVVKDFGEIPELFCMPNQLNQVFMNLLLNASHAIGSKGGKINIKTWADEKNIYVSTKDNGCGIPEENLKKIFEPFYTTKDVGKGTGLGLSLAFDIIKKHKGIIDVKSEVGVGTEFIITLPLEGIDELKRDLVVG